MTDDEINMVQKLIEYKILKSKSILERRYPDAAEYRDVEKTYEIKLYKFLCDSDSYLDKESIIEMYFRRKLGLSYRDRLKSDFEIQKYESIFKRFLRNTKLKQLGI